MPESPAPPPPPVSGWRYRFDGVEIDLVARRLRIDGEERPCSQRALQLLEILCAQPGVLLARNHLIDALWPGGQVVSDEALTQIIFRTRAVLGPYADRLATVRGAGLRLDAQVRREAVAVQDIAAQADVPPDAGAAEKARVPDVPVEPAVAPGAAPPQASETRLRRDAPPVTAVARRRRRSMPWLLAALLAVTALLAAWQWRSHVPAADTAPIDVGYGLDTSDAHATDPMTPSHLRDAFRQEAIGDRERARALLEAVHAGDATTPIPALYLALWGLGAGDMARADAWLDQARSRLAPLRNANLSAQLHWIEAERANDARAVVRHAGAVLDLRPKAWQMRNARAHLLLAMQLRDAAREELQQVDVSSIDHRKLAMSVADRAALGDVAGAQAVFDRAQAGMDEPEREFLRGRIAWSRGDPAAARDAFAASIAAGEKRARFALLQRALMHLGVIELELGHAPQSRAALERAHALARDTQARIDELDTALLLAQLHADAGDGAAMRRWLQAAMRAEQGHDGSFDGYVAVFVARLAPDLVPPDAGADEPAALRLLAARRAVAAGDRAAAGAALDEAIALGALQVEMAEETRLLQAELGRPVAPPTALDPPFPPQSRRATRHVLAMLQAAGSSASP